ncbi:hypothetical protein G7Y89_g10724 [Cudoniella acicularis]|uniref:Cytochrome P450 n=1 Tax=Cudoniella acicularis TaxID=354080 RepID=A0A8H4W1B7_9HELO|nr:hypothetical protein G7Y89_g10724 [Cudoniella acicularis]
MLLNIGIWETLAIVASTLISVAIYGTVYNLYFHPLAKFPGPKLFAFAEFPYVFSILRGRVAYTIKDLHTQYGPIIRMAPNELVFSSAPALKDVYTRQGEKPSFPKDPNAYTTPPGGVHSILTVRSDADHSRYRRLLAHSFSEKSLQEQAPLIKTYVDLLIYRLHSCAADGPQNMLKWFNYVSFDIIGDLTLGESFNSLQESGYHPWVSFLLVHFKSSAFLAQARKYPLFAKLLMKFIPKEVIQGRIGHAKFAKEKVLSRMEMGTERPDFMTGVLKHNDKETGITVEEIIPTFAILIVAGSETISTLLSAVTFYLLKYPSAMKKLITEIRTTFKTEEEINQISVNSLKYMLAVLDEALRLLPPTPRGGPRVVPGDGEVVDGVWIPGGTIVTVATYSANRQPSNWADPDEFVPERWLENAPQKYKNDNKAAFSPFSLGPRNCIGRNLAYAEMRTILARLLWNFDLELDERSEIRPSHADDKLLKVLGNFLGLKFTGSSTVGTCVDLPKGFSDNVTSGKAKPGFRCTTDVKCKGTGFSFNEKPGSEKFPAWIDNKSSSWKCVAA